MKDKSSAIKYFFIIVVVYAIFKTVIRWGIYDSSFSLFSLVIVAFIVIRFISVLVKKQGKPDTKTGQDPLEYTSRDPAGSETSTSAQSNVSAGGTYDKSLEELNGGKRSNDFCPYCGTPLSGSIKTCSNCGSKINL